MCVSKKFFEHFRLAGVCFIGLLLNRFSRDQLCDPIDGSPPGSSIHGIFQASVLEWGAIAFSDLIPCQVASVVSDSV